MCRREGASEPFNPLATHLLCSIVKTRRRLASQKPASTAMSFVSASSADDLSRASAAMRALRQRTSMQMSAGGASAGSLAVASSWTLLNGHNGAGYVTHQPTNAVSLHGIASRLPQSLAASGQQHYFNLGVSTCIPTEAVHQRCALAAAEGRDERRVAAQSARHGHDLGLRGLLRGVQLQIRRHRPDAQLRIDVLGRVVRGCWSHLATLIAWHDCGVAQRSHRCSGWLVWVEAGVGKTITMSDGWRALLGIQVNPSTNMMLSQDSMDVSSSLGSRSIAGTHAEWRLPRGARTAPPPSPCRRRPAAGGRLAPASPPTPARKGRAVKCAPLQRSDPCIPVAPSPRRHLQCAWSAAAPCVLPPSGPVTAMCM